MRRRFPFLRRQTQDFLTPTKGGCCFLDAYRRRRGERLRRRMPACRLAAASVAGQCARNRNGGPGGAGQSFKGGGGGRGGSDSMRKKKQEPPKKKPEPKDETPKSCPRRVVGLVLGFLDQTWLQTLQYIIFLFAFQSLTGTIRKSEEFYFDKYLTDTFISNPFDADHNRFMDVRRIADIWEWKQKVLVPGLFGHSATGEFWPDGDGPFSIEGATPYSTYEAVEHDNAVSFTQGIVIKQVRGVQWPRQRQRQRHQSSGSGSSS